ncbi:MAG: hypothetical protein P1U70_09650 [Saprospiraceae bacterium]|jgi:hypothetical protein|nr:hypothetical protein [Saprospiraceae bacterium]
MNLPKKIINTTLLLFILICAYGCLATAKLSDFPNSANSIDFEKYSNEYSNGQQPNWTFETSSEYYFERELKMSEAELFNRIQKAMRYDGYKLNEIDLKNNRIIGRRGLSANEWNAMTGVYWKEKESTKKIQLYIITKITQDITGGWTENRAQKIGKLIEIQIDQQI